MVVDLKDYQQDCVDAFRMEFSKEDIKCNSEVKKLAKEVLSSGVSVKLDPMNSFERRIVHNVISEFDGLFTRSEGEAPNRYVVIMIKED